MTIRALIVDDEAPARDELAYLLEDHPDVSAIQAATAEEALSVIARGLADVVFQDIHMPGQDGFHVLSCAKDFDPQPLFVFVTAYDQHAIRAFEENAADYLLKPVSPDRLAKSLDRVRNALAAHEQAPLKQAVEKLLSCVGQGRPLPKLAVEQNGRISLIALSRVALIEAEEKRLMASTDTGRLPCHGMSTLAKACERLAGLSFFQANRAQMVNLDLIAELSPWFGGKYHLVMADKERSEVVVSRNRAREFKTRLGI